MKKRIKKVSFKRLLLPPLVFEEGKDDVAAIYQCNRKYNWYVEIKYFNGNSAKYFENGRVEFGAVSYNYKLVNEDERIREFMNKSENGVTKIEYEKPEIKLEKAKWNPTNNKLLYAGSLGEGDWAFFDEINYILLDKTEKKNNTIIKDTILTEKCSYKMAEVISSTYICMGTRLLEKLFKM